MFPGGNGNADLGYNKHPHAHGHGHGHSHNQFLAQPPPPPPHFSLPPGGGPGIVNPMMATSLPLGMQGGAGIDWAQLAQQWIHMRDAGPAAVSMPVSACPPPPVIGNVRDYHHQPTLALPLTSVVRAGYPGVLEEHGEADMDMDDDNERGHGGETPPPPAPVVTQSQWLAVNEAPALSVPASSDAAVTLGKQQWSNWHAQPGKAATATGNPTAHIPSLLKINVSNPNEPHQQLQLLPPQQPTQPHHQPATQQQHQQQPQQQQQHAQQPQQQQHLEGGSGGGASSELDANKRKMLPAWIREGLEKMEREKQRQLERQQSSSHVPSDMPDAEVDVHVKQVSSKTLTTPVNLLNIASVASDSEDSIDLPAGVALGVGGELKELQIGNELLSKATTDGTSDSSDDDQQEEQRGREASVKDEDVNGKNYEERLADLMLVVRRTLTEILLETTNEEIAAIAGETLKAHRAKASSAQVIRKSALSSITGNLGLAAYGDSSSESEEDEDEEDGERQAEAGKDLDKSVHLSAEELKARIRRSKRSFERVIDDIEDRVAKQEHRDEQTLQRHRKRELERSDNAGEQRRPLANPDSLGETASRPTHEKLQQYNGKRPSRKERTTRFSDNKDGKQQSQSYVQQVVATVATVAPPASVNSSSVPPKLKPVPNVATNLLQMPESVATMLSAADKALNKANKSSRKPKSKRRQSSTSSSTSSSDSSSSSSDSDDSSSTTSGSKTSSSRSKRSSRHGHRSQHGSSSSRSKYDRRSDRHRERERDRDRDRERERDRRTDRHHYSGGSSSSHRQRQQRHRGSSHSAEDDGGGGSSSYHRSSRPSSSRSHDHGSSTSGRKRHRTRSRSKSRSTHHSSSNAYTSSSSASHSRKRH